MSDVPVPVAKDDQKLLNTIARRIELEKKLNPNLDYVQALALKEIIAELEARNQRHEALARSRQALRQSVGWDSKRRDRAA